jgi:hypothetical protein
VIFSPSWRKSWLTMIIQMLDCRQTMLLGEVPFSPRIPILVSTHGVNHETRGHQPWIFHCLSCAHVRIKSLTWEIVIVEHPSAKGDSSEPVNPPNARRNRSHSPPKPSTVDSTDDTRGAPTASMYKPKKSEVRPKDPAKLTAIDPSAEVKEHLSSLPGYIREYLGPHTLRHFGGDSHPELTQKINSVLATSARHLEADLEWLLKDSSAKAE